MCRALTGQIWKSYYFAGSQAIAMRVQGDPVEPNNGLFFLHSDHLGSASLTTNASGAATARQLYDAWGNIRANASSGTMPTDLGYTGKRADVTGLVYLGARYYSPSVSRFVSADTIVPDPKQSRDLNRYTYGGNNPLTLIDINGHQVPPKCSGTICSTGTGGPYVVSIAGPEVQPLTIGTTKSSSDVAYVAKEPWHNPKDGLYIVVSSDTRTFLRGEAGAHLSADGPVVNVSGERRFFYQTYSDGTSVSGWESSLSGSAGAQVAGSGVSFGAERTWGDNGATDTSLTASGKLFGVVEGTAQLQGNQIMAGLSGKRPVTGEKVSIYGGFELGINQHFITNQGYFDSLGGEQGFINMHGRPGARITYFERVSGPLDSAYLCGDSGFNLLLNRVRSRAWLRREPMRAQVVP